VSNLGHSNQINSMNRNRYIFIALFLILIAVAMFVASFILVRKDSGSRTVVVPTPVATFTPAPTPTPTPLPDGAFLYNGQILGLANTSDADGDWVSDRLEYNQYGTNPLLIDSDGGGVDDFNELFIYGMNPLAATDDAEFMAQIPNVEGRNIAYDAGGVIEPGVVMPLLVNVSERDPFLKWIANNTYVFWNSANRDVGSLKIDWNGDYIPIFEEWIDYNLSAVMTPAWYFTHGRNGVCAESALVNYIVMELKKYDCEYVVGTTPEGSHAWLEADSHGTLYVVNFNDIVLASVFYAEHPDWSIVMRLDFD
jgi:hypothetical protein